VVVVVVVARCSTTSGDQDARGSAEDHEQAEAHQYSPPVGVVYPDGGVSNQRQ
jgi:hypothetical protein